MNIIVEGPDGSGKTTLVNQLAEQLNMGVRSFKQPEKDGILGKQFEFYRDLSIDIYGTILDRSFYSDMVYGPVFRGNSELRTSDMIELERGFDDTFVIYCTGDPQLMWDAAVQRGEEYVTSFKQYTEICKLYDDLFFNRFHYLPIHVRSATWLTK